MEYTGAFAANMIEIGFAWKKKAGRKNEKP
jgi:hypothetical protein